MPAGGAGECQCQSGILKLFNAKPLKRSKQPHFLLPICRDASQFGEVDKSICSKAFAHISKRDKQGPYPEEAPSKPNHRLLALPSPLSLCPTLSPPFFFSFSFYPLFYYYYYYVGYSSYCFIQVPFYPEIIYFLLVHFILNELSPSHFLTSEIFVKISSLKSLVTYHPKNHKIFRLSHNLTKRFWVKKISRDEFNGTVRFIIRDLKNFLGFLEPSWEFIIFIHILPFF